MVAAQNNQKAILKVLYKFGVNINEQDYKGNTALHYANMYGSASSDRSVFSREFRLKM